MRPPLTGGFGPEDRETWRILFDHLAPTLPGRCRPEYLEGLAAIGLCRDTIPSLEELGERFVPLTGWTFVEVAGGVPSDWFFRMLADRRFPVTGAMRPREELWHSSKADFFHDVIGHVPLLSNRTYSEFVVGISEVALRHLGDPPSLQGVAHTVAWTVEYGLMGAVDDPQAYGGALISSPRELEHALGPVPRRRPFEPAALVSTTHSPPLLHDQYFVVGSFEELRDSVESFADVAAALATKETASRPNEGANLVR